MFAPRGYFLTAWLFLRLLGLIYLVAFASFIVQLRGLIGSNGILPAQAYLAALKKSLGRRGFWYAPSLAWLNSGDRALLAIAGVGLLAAALLIAGYQATPVLVACWLAYLSLVTISQEFLSYQWDALLLEAGFLAIFLAPPSLLPAQALAAPPPLMIFLFRWLVFRLMWMSGLAKLVSRDPTWRDLTALAYHYETQPLPNPLAWLVHKAPLAFQKFSTLFSLMVEALVPFLFFLPGWPSYLAAGLTIMLQVLILLTGNFAFFNYLTIFLTLFLLDDGVLTRLLPAGLLSRLAPVPLPPGLAIAWDVLAGVVALLSLGMGLVFLLRMLNRRQLLPGFLQPVLFAVQSFRLVNSYGLFAAMTLEQLVIEVQGSQDGENWRAYEFKYKPGDLRRSPPVVAPHQPRLDWQMWFAALSSYDENPWFVQLAVRLLLGSPEVLRLLQTNPFPEKPPTYVRALLHRYHFTSFAERRQSGEWWQRELLGIYLPPISLKARPEG